MRRRNKRILEIRNLQMNKKSNVTILAIETSCDETAAAVLRGEINAKTPRFETLSNVIKSQIKLHSRMGGVVPEVAARAHTSAIRPVVEKALHEAKLQITNYKLQTSHKSKILKSKIYSSTTLPLSTDIDYIAVTSGPGLIASLLVGVEFAKGLAFATDKKMVAVNHMEGHLYSPFGTINSKLQILNNKKTPNSKLQTNTLPLYHSTTSQSPTEPVQANNQVKFPILSLIVSGGHTLLVLQKNESTYQVLGSTVDDAAGEAFDKIAKLLGLPYPGGPEISKLAAQGKPVISFPRPMLNSQNFDFSFSGLKTAVLYYLEDNYPSLRRKTGNKNKAKKNLHHFNFSNIPAAEKANLAASFEEAVVDVLVTKTLRAAKKYNCKTVSLSGGVAANKRLRQELNLKCQMSNMNFIVPDFRLCTDNAEMIALAAYFKLRAGYKPVNFGQIKADSSWEI